MANLQPQTSGSNPITSAEPNLKPKLDPAKVARPPNPIYKYMGLGENFRPRLPSRNWMIFLTITGSFTSAVIYDKRETKRAQRKWCKLVEHVAREPLAPREMPRRLTVFLEAPPFDGLRVAQDHFKEYVKPIMVASGLDWEFIQGRKEGDIRLALAERIRNSRVPENEKLEEDPILATRKKQQIQEYDGPKGDIVIGRHTWKEYIRGLHEGWLGPLTEPLLPATEEQLKPEEEIETLPGITITSTPKDDPNFTKSDSKPKEVEKIKAAYISTSEYTSVTIPIELPPQFDPSIPISFPHVLGFRSTLTRLYRFLNRRKLADSIGHDTAAAILSVARPYSTSSSTLETSQVAIDDTKPSLTNEPQPTSSLVNSPEQDAALSSEEKEWHKSVHKHPDDEPERIWLDPVTLDPRIAGRMRKFVLSADGEAAAKKIVVLEEEIEGHIKGGLRYLGRMGLEALGLRKEKKPIVSENDETLLE